jgi:hypothetical protein
MTRSRTDYRHAARYSKGRYLGERETRSPVLRTAPSPSAKWLLTRPSRHGQEAEIRRRSPSVVRRGLGRIRTLACSPEAFAGRS